MEKSKSAQDLGRKSAQKRHEGKTKEQIAEYYRNLRSKRKDLTPQTTS